MREAILEIICNLTQEMKPDKLPKAEVSRSGGTKCLSSHFAHRLKSSLTITPRSMVAWMTQSGQHVIVNQQNDIDIPMKPR